MNYIDQFPEPCQKDEVLILNSNHTYISADAGTACSPNVSFTGDWSLSSNIHSVDGDPGTIESLFAVALMLQKLILLQLGASSRLLIQSSNSFKIKC